MEIVNFIFLIHCDRFVTIGVKNVVFKPTSSLLINLAKQMSINVQSCGYFGMSHLFLNVFRILALPDQKACISMSEVVKSDYFDFCLFQ